MGAYPFEIFVHMKNSIYIPNRDTGQIHVWLNESNVNPTKTISRNLSYLSSIFVTTNGDIYIDNEEINPRIDKWIAENETWISVTSFPIILL